MKNRLAFLILLTACGSSPVSISQKTSISDTHTHTHPKGINTLEINYTTDNKPSNVTGENGSGCCSYHGGVCGCSGNKAVCCDGQLSPSCGCFSDFCG
jgi:hypothetical protein